MHRSLRLALVLSLVVSGGSWARAADNVPPEGFTALFNGKDLSGWHGMGTFDPYKLAAMTDAERAEKRAKDLEDLKMHWKVEDGQLVNDGKGVYLTTDESLGDIELLVDYKLLPKGDSGIYLRATPQIQIWDYTEPTFVRHNAQKGSGGLWNNRAGSPGKDPSELADKPIGEWNTFRVVQVGARTSVWLNGKLVVDHAILENFWDKEKKKPLLVSGPVQLQTHGSEVRWKNVFVRKIGAEEANTILAKHGDEGQFKPIFNGKDLDGWKGPTENYEAVDGTLRCKPKKGGTIYHQDELSDFVVRLEFKMPEGGNNGLAIRYPGEGDTAYVGMCELQVLDDNSPKYAKLDPRQFHGSAYGMAAAYRGYQRPVGEWNFQEVTVKGSTVKVELNGSVILDTDLSTITEYMGKNPHPGKDRTSGFFGFAGHGADVAFRNVRVKKLEAAPAAK